MRLIDPLDDTLVCQDTARGTHGMILHNNWMRVARGCRADAQCLAVGGP